MRLAEKRSNFATGSSRSGLNLWIKVKKNYVAMLLQGSSRFDSCHARRLEGTKVEK
jgi:hypothetical protein